MELPIAFEKRMKELLGVQYADFYNALCREDAVKGLRVNTRKVSVETFVANAPFALKPIPYLREGFIVAEEAQAGKHPYHAAGAYYMQDPGAMSTVAALPAELWQHRGLRILDLCAAPGGKTTHLAALCAPTGGIVMANEYVASRSRILAGNVERMGLDNVCVTHADTRYFAQHYPECFDLVVVDAPCSGEGMFRKNALAVSEWSEENVRMCAERQEEILSNAVTCVAPGGYLLYSTCTYSTEENEERVAAFLRKNGEFSLIPCDRRVVECTADGIAAGEANGNDLTLCRRFYPHVCEGEGQFLALLQRCGERERCRTAAESETLPKGIRSVADAFLRELTGETLSPLLLRHGFLCAFPALSSAPLSLPMQTVAVGVPIGEERKGRIVPHHHLFMCCGKSFLSTLTLAPTDPRLARFLAGEEIEAPAECKGYTAVLVRMGEERIPVGGGKASGGRLKNYYPKGLRVR